jgi:hypothetical protein
MVGVLAAGALALGPGRAAAQSGTLPITVEARLDAGIPTGNFAHNWTVGLGWAVDGAFELTPQFAIYGGYSRFDWSAKDNGADAGLKLKDDGFDVGGRVILGTGAGALTPYAQFGALIHNGDTGFEVGLGGDYPVASNISLTPLVRFRKVGDLNYVTAGVGATFRL